MKFPITNKAFSQSKRKNHLCLHTNIGPEAHNQCYIKQRKLNNVVGN